MTRGDVLFCANCEVSRFKVLRQRDQLPFFDWEEHVQKGEDVYRLEDALGLRVMLDLTGGDLGGAAGNRAFDGLGPSYAGQIVSFLLEMLEQDPGLAPWIGVVVMEDRLEGEVARHPEWFFGDLKEVATWIENKRAGLFDTVNGLLDSQPVRAFLVNAERAETFVRARARARGLPDADKLWGSA